MRYQPKVIESKWQRKWLAERVYEPDFRRAPLEVGRLGRLPMRKRTGLLTGRAKKPFYNLMMFPYPSAEGLHIGSVRTFTGVDIYGRFKRMQGCDVFEPIGLDGFGIHSENYALKIGKHPAELANITEKNYYRQLGMIGNGFAWNERLETYDPEYYKWTQWIFLQMFKRGLAYRKKSAVNWCSNCKTVLADEQVIQKSQSTNSKAQINSKFSVGVCERCDTPVIKKELEQWFFRITNYAERLLKNLDKIDWSENIKIAQKNWIGKSEGAEITFEIKTDKKPNFVLVHGYRGSPEKNFFPWLKAELERRGHRVFVPALPNADNPLVAEQVEYVLRHAQFDQNTVLLGHSLGSVVAMKVMERLKRPIAKLILTGGFTKPKFEDHSRPFEKVFDWKFNFDKIRKNASEIHILHDVNDKIVSRERARELHHAFKSEVTYFSAQGMHICGTEEPEVLRHALDTVTVFTTRPDTLFGATYLVLGPEHKLISNLKSQISNLKEVDEYIQKAKSKSEEERIAEGKEKTGVELKGVRAINPANGEEIPVWVADYVLDRVGSGAIMAVPAHDRRDFEFAKKFGLSVRQVIEPLFTQSIEPGKVIEGLPFDHRDSIIAIVKHWSEKKYIGLKWRKVAWGTFITGGIEKGQTAEGAAMLEIREETGFLHPKLIADFGIVHGKFYHVPKKVNRFAHARVLYFELQDNTREDITTEEQENHEVFWLTKEELKKFLTPDSHQWALEMLNGNRAYTGGGLLTNAEKFIGMGSEQAKWEITKLAGGKRQINYRLRDWLISRQRYWGPPIPMIFCEACKEAGRGEQTEMPGWYAVPEKDLPVKLPYIENFRPTGTDKSPLATVEHFYKVRCPKCTSWARRETDVSDTFLDSAWYYLGYLILNQKSKIKNQKFIFEKTFLKKWLPVDMYIGGAEHAVLHLLYARFIAMAFYDWDLVHFEEPFTRFRSHGLITKGGAKMSKSKGNVVNPDEYIAAYGADAIRMYLAFLAPFTHGGDFRDEGIKGITRFLERVWNLVRESRIMNHESRKKNTRLRRHIHKAIKKVTEDIENLQYNTAISALMILLNEFEANAKAIAEEDIQIFLKLLAPFAPHITEELWQQMQGKGKFNSIHKESWPKWNPREIKEETFEMMIQINGKVRDKVEVPVTILEEEAKRLTLSRDKIKNIIRSQKPRKIIFVQGRLINVVV